MNKLLDSLPDDLFGKIVSLIKGYPNSYSTALLFAESSEVRRREIAKVMSYKLVLTEKQSHLFTRLINMLGDKLYLLVLIHIKNQTLLANIPHIPSLRQVILTPNKEQLSIIKGCRELRDVVFYTFPGTPWDVVSSTLASLPKFRYLLMHIHRNLQAPSLGDQERLAEVCARIKQFHFRSGNDDLHKYWPMISKLRCIEVFSLFGSIHREQIPWVRKVREVRIMGRNAVRKASQLGKNVTVILQTIPVSMSSISRLHRCPNILRMHLVLKDGAEAGLWGNVSKLESMGLCWRNTEEGRGPPYYHAKGMFLVQLVTRATKLQKILLMGAAINGIHLTHVIKSMNNRLTHIGTNLDGQDETIPTRLVRILASLTAFCPNVQFLILKGLTGSVVATQRERRRCLNALSRVRVKCPKLKVRDLIDYVYHLRRTPAKRKWEEFLETY